MFDDRTVPAPVAARVLPERLEPPSLPPLEMWGGVECTINRVGDRYHDQSELTGHAGRIDDIDRIAELGIRRVRYPVLWERVARHGLEGADWTWVDARLHRLRELGVSPIAGLVHHGSGPPYATLLDRHFPECLAEYALAVARRHPWIDAYTPVNEPLTTARFCGLYGHWYPHGADDRTFVRTLLHECRGSILAMQAIRTVNPSAQLVQTDDMGRSFSTPALAYQAEFENHRRWLGWDLLAGRVDTRHPLWNYLRGAGASSRELGWFLDHPCPPDVVGINYYLTSDRVLDERLERYPDRYSAGNGRHAYADIEAVRTSWPLMGHRALLEEAWERYKRPVAVTEAHLGCTREEQMRWLVEAWEAARDAREAGADVRAVTVWALFGLSDWNSLVTRLDGHYEPGAYDTRGPEPRRTALSGLIRDLAHGSAPAHPCLADTGWWRRDSRILERGRSRGASKPAVMAGRRASTRGRPKGRPSILITGGSGTLGGAFARVCLTRGLSHCVVTRQEVDIADDASVPLALDHVRPWAVINAAGYVRVDDAEAEAGRCRRENTDGPAILARECARRGIRLVSFSSDLVFDGSVRRPYVESDPAEPVCMYGRSKADAERLVLEAWPEALVARTSAFFGPWDRWNFLHAVLEAAAAGRRFAAPFDQRVSPTYVPDLVHATLDLLIDGATGLWHLANTGDVSWADFARQAAAAAGYTEGLIEDCETASLALPAPRPAYSVLGTERGQMLPPLGEALQRFFLDRADAPLMARRLRREQSQFTDTAGSRLRLLGGMDRRRGAAA